MSRYDPAAGVMHDQVDRPVLDEPVVDEPVVDQVPPGSARARLEVSEDLASLVTAAVQKRLRTEAEMLAGFAFEEQLTPELATVMKDRADAAMAVMLQSQQLGNAQAEQEVDDELATQQLVAAGPLFPTVQAWVAGFLARTIVRRSSQDFVWCPQWWAHAEVVTRLTGLWTTWEQARLGDPADVNTWWLQQLDPHLAVITAQGGPLDGCSSHDGHGGTKPGLRIAEPPAGTFGPP